MSCTVITRRPDEAGVDYLHAELTAADVVTLIHDNAAGTGINPFIELPQEDGGKLFVRSFNIIEVEDDSV